MILITSGGDAVQLFDLRFYDDRFHNGEVLIKATFYEPDENDVPQLVCMTIAKRFASTQEQLQDAFNDFQNNVRSIAVKNTYFEIPDGWIRMY